MMDEKLGKLWVTSESLSLMLTDRPGHDKRYAIDATKINQRIRLETIGYF